MGERGADTFLLRPDRDADGAGRCSLRAALDELEDILEAKSSTQDVASAILEELRTKTYIQIRM